MAKKGNRIVVLMECEECKNKNYSTSINHINQREKKLKIKKFCKNCRKHTLHRMVKK